MVHLFHFFVRASDFTKKSTSRLCFEDDFACMAHVHRAKLRAWQRGVNPEAKNENRSSNGGKTGPFSLRGPNMEQMIVLRACSTRSGARMIFPLQASSRIDLSEKVSLVAGVSDGHI